MNIYIFGCGAIGSNLLTNLICDYNDAVYTVIDKDKVESRNIQAGTQFYFREQIGMFKTAALRLNIYQTFNKKIDSVVKEIKNDKDILELINSKDSLIVDSFDNAKSRNLLTKVCLENNINCIHVAFSPQMTFEIVWNRKDLLYDEINQGIDICEAVGARSFIKSVCGIAGNVIIDFFKNNIKKDIIGNKFLVREI